MMEINTVAINKWQRSDPQRHCVRNREEQRLYRAVFSVCSAIFFDFEKSLEGFESIENTLKSACRYLI